jgi:hypothetical protein
MSPSDAEMRLHDREVPLIDLDDLEIDLNAAEMPAKVP